MTDSRVREWREANKGRLLTQDEADALPVGTEIEVVWSGGNGPHRYFVGEDAVWCRLGSGDYRVGLLNFVGLASFHTQVVLVEGNEEGDGDE